MRLSWRADSNAMSINGTTIVIALVAVAGTVAVVHFWPHPHPDTPPQNPPPQYPYGYGVNYNPGQGAAQQQQGNPYAIAGIQALGAIVPSIIDALSE